MNNLKYLSENKYFKIYEMPLDKNEKIDLLKQTHLGEEEINLLMNHVFLCEIHKTYEEVVELNIESSLQQSKLNIDKIYKENIFITLVFHITQSGRFIRAYGNSIEGNIYLYNLHNEIKQKHTRLDILKYL